MNSFVLHMDGALAGWGTSAATSRYRDTADYPQKSHIVGILSAALGYGVGDPRIKQLSDKIDTKILYDYSDKGEIQPDYNTANGDPSDYYDLDGMPEKIQQVDANGGVKKTASVAIKWYRSNPRYNIRISSNDEELIEDLIYAVNHPYYPLYLGRKCCSGDIHVISSDEELSYQKNEIFNKKETRAFLHGLR